MLQLVLAIFITILFLHSNAQPGTLDNSFDSDGKVLNSFPMTVKSIALQNSGKIIVAGQGNNSVVKLLRFNDNGSIDNSFGIGGIVTVSDGNFKIVNNVIIQPDQGILVGGVYETGGASFWKYAVIRFSENGVLDNTFGLNGVALCDTTNYPAVNCPPINNEVYHIYDDYGNAGNGTIALQSDGKIVQSGLRLDACAQQMNNAPEQVFVCRYNTDGSLDTSFHYRIGPTKFYTKMNVTSLYIDTADWIFVGGHMPSYLSTIDTGIVVPTVVTFPPNGMNDPFDPTFYRFNIVELNGFNNIQQFESSFLVGHYGGLVVGGSVYVGGKSKFAVARFFDTYGFLSVGMDTTFGGNNNGIAIIDPVIGDSYMRAGLVQPDGKIILAGHGDAGGFTLEDFILVRLNSNGTIDNTFGNNGIVTTDLDNNTIDNLSGICFQNDGKLLAGGTARIGFTSIEIGVTRYNNDASLSIDNFEEPFEVAIMPNPSSTQITVKLKGKQSEQINIYDYSGQLLKIINQPVDNTIDVSDMASGIYLAEVKVDGLLQRVKWVKM